MRSRFVTGTGTGTGMHEGVSFNVPPPSDFYDSGYDSRDRQQEYQNQHQYEHGQNSPERAYHHQHAYSPSQSPSRHRQQQPHSPHYSPGHSPARGAPSSSHRQDNFDPHFDFGSSFQQQQQQQQQQLGPGPFFQSVGGGRKTQITDQQLKAWEASKKRVNFGIMSAVKGVAKVLPAQFRLDKDGRRLHAERQKRLMMAKLEEEKRHAERVRVREERRMEGVLSGGRYSRNGLRRRRASTSSAA